MTTMTKRDAVEAAMSLADDVAEGRLSPSDLEAQAVSELRELFGTVVGEGDPLWELHANVARQAVGLGALSADELTEWAAVMRRRAGEPLEPSGPHDDPLPAQSLASEAESHDSGDAEAADDAEPAPLQGVSIVTALAALASAAQQAHVEPTPTPAPQPSGEGYDATRGWQPGNTRRL
ncbi:hypothetical protein [Mycolicibacterium brisbanense]|uniref:Flagellar hook-length control protein n=1 Tax=Mycolicibacterium brisbanense TaxID=146020 RepID=A0A117I6R0_9MYCO|nr:hypothetical protein [Mycolicibacterium brisbanense]MCV7158466.1 flagellar hook-length control protein [Mycolicibacterium brisbanense]GAS90482.1 flagellar hook-length control protein [Mycolicibacterium brisbanense]